jgi:branched-chain amino acid transport system ATP-binding protein
VTKRFGGVTAISNCTVHLKENSITGLIGPNGSGKTTLMNLINGFFKPDAGVIYFKGKDITGLEPHKIARLGIGRLFQVPRIFSHLTVAQNVLLPAIPLWNKGEIVQRAAELLTRADLIQVKDELAENISHGQQRLTEICRALMADPELILLDEPFSGLHFSMIEKMVSIIKEFRALKKTFLVVSHNISTIMDICDTIIVLSSGIKIAEGKPQEIQNNQRVIDAYLGG